MSLVQPAAAAASAAAASAAAGGDRLLAKLTDAATRLLRPTNDRAGAQRDALFAFAVRVASAALLYVSQVILARWMGGHDYGVFVFVWTWVLVLGGLSPLGLSVLTLRLVPEYRETGRHELSRGLIRGGRLMAVGGATAIAGLGAATLWLIQDHVDNTFVLPLFLAFVCVPMFTLCDIQDCIGRAHGWMGVSILPMYIIRPVLLLAAMWAAHDMGWPMTAVTAAAAAIVSMFLAALWQTLVMNRRLTRLEGSGAKPAYDFPGWLRMAAPLWLMVGADILLQNTDVLVVSTYLPPDQVGVYFAAAKTMALVMFVHYAVGSATAARFSSLNARGDKAALAKFAGEAVNWTFWPSLAASIVILTLGWPLLSLFGAEFSTGYPLMFVLVIGFLFKSAMGPAEHMLNMLGQQKACAAVMAVTVVLNLAMNLILVPRLGLMGAAIATATSLSIAALSHAAVARRRLGIEIPIWRNLPRR